MPGLGLKAMVPVVPFDSAYEVAYEGGALLLAFVMGWGTGVGGMTLEPGEISRTPSGIFPSHLWRSV